MINETFMHRCFELARLGAGAVAPNPMVGAVLVHADTIIGEGYHRQWGQAHAEVNCINSVSAENRQLIETSCLYVSLEPCAHYGKTPPCADLVIANKIPQVVIGCRDSFGQVDGKGIKKLIDAGVMVTVPVLEQQALQLNKRFFTFHNKRRPFVILKWAQSANGKIGSGDEKRLLISNELTNRRVHKWRSMEASILVGTNTARMDDPMLTNRLWPGGHPLRLVIDTHLQLPRSLHLFDGSTKTIVFNTDQERKTGELHLYKLPDRQSILTEILSALYSLQVLSVLVEGGNKLLQSFIDEGHWDEARIISNTKLDITGGTEAPILSNARQVRKENLLSDSIVYYERS